MPDVRDDEKIPLSWMISEGWYHTKRKVSMFARGVLYKVMPRWLVREAFMYSQRYIRDNEIIPEVAFMTVFERICKNDLSERHRGTRVTK